MTTQKGKAKSHATKAKRKAYRNSRSKQAQLVALLRRPQGATIDELSTATGWQSHSVRGAMSGSLHKRLGLTITSEKEKRGRVYRIAAAG